MKFRAKIAKEQIVALHSITATFERIASVAAIFLTPDSVRISLVPDRIDVPRCYAELLSNVLFAEYRIESQTDNTILFEIGLPQLSKALVSGKSALQGQLKLTKKEGKPCLTFETKAQESVLFVDIVHDIPIKMLKQSDIVYYMPPNIPAPDVALELPRGKLLKTIIDRMMKFSKNILLSASQSGRLSLRVEHPGNATIKSYFNGLVPRFVGQLDPAHHTDNTATVKLNLKKFSVVMNMQSLQMEDASVYIANNASVMLFITLSPPQLGSVSYYVPVMVMNEDEEDEEEAEADLGQDNDGDQEES